MSVNMSSFPPQSSGGGVYVLKLVEGEEFTKIRLNNTFSAEYGGVLAISIDTEFARYGGTLTVDGINVIGNGPSISNLYPFTTWLIDNQIIAMQIPFKESIFISRLSNNTSGVYWLYKYVLVE